MSARTINTRLALTVALSLCCLPVLAQQATLNSLKASCEAAVARIASDIQRQKDDALTQYGKTLGVSLQAVKEKGDLEAYLVVEKEEKRFQADRTVPADAHDASIANAAAEYRKQVSVADVDSIRRNADLLNKYIAALNGLIKDLMTQNRMEDAKAAGDAKRAAEFVLADTESRLPRVEPPVPPPKVVEYPDIAGVWIEDAWTYNLSQTGGSIKMTGFGLVPRFGKATCEGEGTISANGQLALNMRWLKKPSWFEPNTRTAQLSSDGLSLSGVCKWRSGIGDCLWKKAKDKNGNVVNRKQTVAAAPGSKEP